MSVAWFIYQETLRQVLPFKRTGFTFLTVVGNQMFAENGLQVTFKVGITIPCAHRAVKKCAISFAERKVEAKIDP